MAIFVDNSADFMDLGGGGGQNPFLMAPDIDPETGLPIPTGGGGGLPIIPGAGSGGAAGGGAAAGAGAGAAGGGATGGGVFGGLGGGGGAAGGGAAGGGLTLSNVGKGVSLAMALRDMQSGGGSGVGGAATAGFTEGGFQKFLPPSLRFGATGEILSSGIQNIGDLISNPGGLSPSVSDAIRARLAATSEGIAQNFRGIRANQAGAAARGNLPVSIRTALDSALDVAQERAQRGARRGALGESEQLRRQDMQQTFAILDAILQFGSSGKGQAIQGLAAAEGLSNQRRASNQAFAGSVLSSF